MGLLIKSISITKGSRLPFLDIEEVDVQSNLTELTIGFCLVNWHDWLMISSLERVDY